MADGQTAGSWLAVDRLAGECGLEWPAAGGATCWRRERLDSQSSFQKGSFKTLGEELVELPRTSH